MNRTTAKPCSSHEVKARLDNYKRLQAEKVQLTNELKRIEALMVSPSTSSVSSASHANGISDPVSGIVSKHDELERRYREQLSRIADAQLEVESMIETLLPTERMVMRYRYIDCLSWDRVCELMSYGWRQTHRIHARALERLAAQRWH